MSKRGAQRRPSPTLHAAAESIAVSTDDVRDLGKTQIAYRKIREAIITCQLAPGSEVTETQLVKLVGLGKAPIRAALARLTHDGLLQAQPRRGYVLSHVTIHSIREIFQLRLKLEPWAARLAAGRLTDKHIKRIRDILDMATTNGQAAGDRIAFLRLNKLFHITVAEATGNQRLADWIGLLLDEVERMLHLGLISTPRAREFQAEHVELFQSLLAGDPDEAERLAFEQIKGGQEMVLASVMKSTGETPESAPAVRSRRKKS